MVQSRHAGPGLVRPRDLVVPVEVEAEHVQRRGLGEQVVPEPLPPGVGAEAGVRERLTTAGALRSHAGIAAGDEVVLVEGPDQGRMFPLEALEHVPREAVGHRAILPDGHPRRIDPGRQRRRPQGRCQGSLRGTYRPDNQRACRTPWAYSCLLGQRLPSATRQSMPVPSCTTRRPAGQQWPASPSSRRSRCR